MKDKVKIGYIGLGRRGFHMLKHTFSNMDDVEIVAVCDVRDDMLERAKNELVSKGRPEPRMTKDYKDIINATDIDAVAVMTGWGGRPAIAAESARAGKYTALEVGCSETLEECYDLVRAYEESGTPIMMLENCCYGRREMMALRMVREGLLGEIVHCTGSYRHYLNNVELFTGVKGDEDVEHYRLKYYIERNRENYPTHEFGPISKILNINRGNRIVSLSSFASKSRGIKEFAKHRYGENSRYASIDYKQGDIVNTILTMENGETVMLTLDTTVPSGFYSRNFSVRGTLGLTDEDTQTVYLWEDGEHHVEIKGNEEEMYKKYDHPLHANYVVDESKAEGHGGMDWLVVRAFVESVKEGTNTPIDVYDSACWLAIGALSERSIEMGGAPVEFPDFTNGAYKTRTDIHTGKYSLDIVYSEQ